MTKDDLVLDGAHSVTPMASWRERINSCIPKYRSPDHDWELVDAKAVTVSSYLTDDGELKQVNWPFNFVTNGNQAAQLARYRLENSRELQPIVLECMPRMRAYRPGECVHLTLPQLGLDHDAIILSRETDPQRLTVKLTLMTEDPAKHAFALGETGTPPPSPALSLTAQQRDELAAAAANRQVTLNEIAPFAVQANSAGATTTTLPLTRAITVAVGGTVQTSGVTVGTLVTAPSAAITATASVASGVVTVSLSKADAAGTVTVPVTFDGVTYQKVIVVDRTQAAPTAGGGGGAGGGGFTDLTWTAISTTSDTQVTDTGAKVQSNASGQLAWSFAASYDGSGAAVVTAQYSLDGTSWTNFASASTGSIPVGGSEPDPGYVANSGTKTGLSNSTDYFVRVIARRFSGSGTVTWSGANFTVTAP